MHDSSRAYSKQLIMHFQESFLSLMLFWSTTIQYHMWCDQAKWVWTRIKWKSSSQLQCMPHIWTNSRDITILVLLKTIKYKGNWILLLALSKKSISASSDSFCLITSHTWWNTNQLRDLRLTLLLAFGIMKVIFQNS